jgi:hypothetical protein
LEKMLVITDGSKNTNRAVEGVAEFAETFRAKVTVNFWDNSGQCLQRDGGEGGMFRICG